MNVKPRLKDARLELRLTKEQKEALQKKAERAKLNLSDYILQTLNV